MRTTGGRSLWFKLVEVNHLVVENKSVLVDGKCPYLLFKIFTILNKIKISFQTLSSLFQCIPIETRFACNLKAL